MADTNSDTTDRKNLEKWESYYDPANAKNDYRNHRISVMIDLIDLGDSFKRISGWKIMKSEKETILRADAVKTLTTREKRVFQMLLSGMKAKEIATENGISIWGANYFIKQIYRKLKVNSKVELLLRYFDFR